MSVVVLSIIGTRGHFLASVGSISDRNCFNSEWEGWFHCMCCTLKGTCGRREEEMDMECRGE